MSARPVKITLAEMRESGVRGAIAPTTAVATRLVAISGDGWPDDIRLSDFGAALRLLGLRQARR